MMAFLNNADEPVMLVPSETVTARHAEIAARVAALEAELPNRFPPEIRWRWATPTPAVETVSGSEVVVSPDASVWVSGSPRQNLHAHPRHRSRNLSRLWLSVARRAAAQAQRQRWRAAISC
jgi:hypothetical protein